MLLGFYYCSQLIWGQRAAYLDESSTNRMVNLILPILVIYFNASFFACVLASVRAFNSRGHSCRSVLGVNRI